MTSDSRWFDHAHSSEQAISMAIHLFVAIPSGWMALWRDTLRQLVAVRTHDREFPLNYLSLEFENGLLELDMPYTDAVLTGIARRCAARSRCICRLCGRRGQVRHFGMMESAVLCARCAAPQLLHCAIDDVLNFPGLIAIGGRVEGLKQVPEVLRRAFLDAASNLRDVEDGRDPHMDAVRFRQWSSELKRLKRALPPRLEFSKTDL